MEEGAPTNAKELAEIFGGFLTWVGVAAIVMALAWWLTAALHWTNYDWRVAMVCGLGGPVAWLIARFIERKRNA
jgi:membrane protein implicated in regulation of membrane protease activity